jgi:protein-S-isoprenylcysteine O-methyltransferase Ste14
MTPAPRRSRPRGPWHGPRGEWLVGIQILLAFAFVLAPPWNPWLTEGLLAVTETPRVAALVIGVLASLGLGLFGALRIRRYLTPLPYPVEHSQLVTTGVYALVRHPLYSSQLFAALGWTLFTLSLGHLALLVLGFLFFDYKASTEEAWLTERHPLYASYAARVSKLIPWIY